MRAEPTYGNTAEVGSVAEAEVVDGTATTMVVNKDGKPTVWVQIAAIGPGWVPSETRDGKKVLVLE